MKRERDCTRLWLNSYSNVVKVLQENHPTITKIEHDMFFSGNSLLGLVIFAFNAGGLQLVQWHGFNGVTRREKIK